MSLFFWLSPGRLLNEVKLYGPLAVDGALVACTTCGDPGQTGRGHVLRRGSAEMRCGAKGHRFTHPGITGEAAAEVGRHPKGPFAVTVAEGVTVTGSTTLAGVFGGTAGAGRERRGKMTGGIAAAQAGAAEPAEGRRRRGGKQKASGGGPGLAGVLAAGLGTVNATVGVVGQGARTVSEVAKVANTTVSAVRDGTGMLAKAQVAAYHQQADARAAAEAAAKRQHESALQAAKLADKAADRDHQSALQAAQAARTSPQAARRKAAGKAGGSASTRAALRKRR
ncbi:hypothetical protein ABZW10_36480 [Kitasatospora sp. NPDC004723]|uniref:hypothetical protein n=1 Tax=Kitasatospora sp. NPDC004723 TaxID=3154288 RepID=UPI0033BBAC04